MWLCACVLAFALCGAGYAAEETAAGGEPTKSGVAAGAEATQLDMAVGISMLSLSGDHDNDLGGWGYDIRFGWLPEPTRAAGLKLGVGLHAAFVEGESDVDPATLTRESVDRVSLLVPEVFLAWRPNLGDPGLVVEPRIGAGPALALFEPRFIFDDDEVGTGWSVRPGIMIGYQKEGTAFGVDVSYASYEIDFEEGVDDSCSEVFAGLFLSRGF